MLAPIKPLCLIIVFLAPFCGFTQTLYPAAQKGSSLFGFIDTTGNFVYKPEYEKALPFRNGYALAMKNKKWGVIDVYNSSVVPFVYDDTQGVVTEGKVTMKKGGFWGVVNLKNETIIPFLYEYLSIFNEGYIVGGKFIKAKGDSKTLDAIILSESRLYLDYGSYKLPGFVVNGRDWSLGQWPVVRDGYITLLFDHSFDYDPLLRLDKNFHYLIPHNVGLGRPHQYYKRIKPGEVIKELPSFFAGFLPQVDDREYPDTLRDTPFWDATADYYAEDAVIVNKYMYRAHRDNRGKNPENSPDDWYRSRPIVIPRYQLTLQRAKTTLLYQVQHNSYDPWDPTYDYYSGDRVIYQGLIYEAIMDNRYKNPTTYDYWQRLSLKPIDTTFVFNFVKSVEPGLTVPGAASYVRTGEDSYLVSVFDSLQLLKQGWAYPLRIPTSNIDLEGAKLSQGIIIARNNTGLKWGCFQINGVITVAFEYDVIGEFNNGFGAARKNGSFGLLKTSGEWRPLPEVQNMVLDFNLRSVER